MTSPEGTIAKGKIEETDLFSGDYFSPGRASRARRFHSSFFDVTPVLDTGFSTFVSLGSRPSPPFSGTRVPFVSSGMENFRLVTPCSQIVNGKRIITKKVVENVRGKTEPHLISNKIVSYSKTYLSTEL
uniref:Uncharacterized protein n=1 Tax=Rhinolophus ferrumequinum TaxID=59479 RepID=A0A671EFE8_RHIFE